MGASITLAGESLIAQKLATLQGLDVARFIFAKVPGLDPSGPVDRAAPKPVAGQIVHVYDIPDGNAGYVNPNQVVYSSQIGSDVGDWDFNWIGLETAENVLFAVAYVPLQQKRRNIPPLQIGNNLTRNFLVAFDGAQALTGITIDASTWQHDFTVRLAGIDERQRLNNRDIYGRSCFFGSSLQLEKVAGAYQLKAGTTYLEGIRVVRSAVLPVVPPAFPTRAWLDVCLQRELSDVVASWQVVWGFGKADYVDSTGVQHYCVAIADLPNANTVTDLRPVEPIAGPLVSQFALRTGDYEGLRARATTKEDVDLGNLPNAKSDDLESDDSEVLATTKALRKALTLPLSVLPFPSIITTNNRLAVTSAAVAGTGGKVSVPAGVSVTLGQEVTAGVSGRRRVLTTADWTSANLSTASTYYLRAQVNAAGNLIIYMQKGADTDPVPGSLKGVPDAVSGGGFESTVLDMLIALVTTGAAGSTPVVTALANAHQLNTEFAAAGAATNLSNFAAYYSQTFLINWARRPTSVPIHAAVAQGGGSTSVEGGANYGRTLTITRYTITCRIQTDWSAAPTSPYGAIEGTATA
ncbi:Tail fiber protein [compost metagenome]